jgi:hypothetical protein
MRNSAYPPALSDDGVGAFDADAIFAFAGLMRAASSNGWTWGNADLAGANWAHLASTSLAALNTA